MKRYSLLALPLALCGILAFAGCGDDDDTTPVTYTRLDRMAIPAINTALIGTANKEAFNLDSPTNDIANWSTESTNNITALRAASLAFLGPEDSPGVPPATLTGVVIPDIVTINFASPVQFPNGRRLQDDVIDAEVGLVLNRGNALGGGGGIPDGIGANDKAFLTVFPYMAAPNMATP